MVAPPGLSNFCSALLQNCPAMARAVASRHDAEFSSGCLLFRCPAGVRCSGDTRYRVGRGARQLRTDPRLLQPEADDLAGHRSRARAELHDGGGRGSAELVADRAEGPRWTDGRGWPRRTDGRGWPRRTRWTNRPSRPRWTNRPSRPRWSDWPGRPRRTDRSGRRRALVARRARSTSLPRRDLRGGRCEHCLRTRR